MTKFVVAGNYEQYLNHIRKMRYDHKEYAYVSDPLQLRGRETIEGFYIGTWRDRPDIEEIKTIIAMIKARTVVVKANAHQYLGTTASDPITQSGAWQPTSIMLKQKGAWQSYDLKSNTITTIPIVDDVESEY